MKGFLAVSCFLVFGFIHAQNKLSFENATHDFGQMTEDGGSAEYTFHFVNSGDVPVTITRVKASCGCTTPGWTKEAVMPGDSGFVKAKYNPKNRPGRFRKSLRLTTTDAASNQTLYISGFVEPTPKTPEEEYPVVVGNFRMQYKGLNMGKITTEKTFEKTFNIYNSSDTVETLNLEDMSIPSHIALAIDGGSLNPKTVGKLRVSYDPIMKKDYGYVSDNIQFGNDGISVMAVIEEFFPEMSAEELDEAPKLQVSEATYDFGKVVSGTILEKEIELSNTGKEKLLFRAIKSNCDCVTYELKNKGIKKGKRQKLKVFFDTSEMRGNQYKSITIYSNDPVTPSRIITIKGSVTRP